MTAVSVAMSAEPLPDIDDDIDQEASDIIADVLRPLTARTAFDVATVAGLDYRDRQRIKRKAARWSEGFAQMPPLERLAILSAIAAAACNEQGGP